MIYSIIGAIIGFAALCLLIAVVCVFLGPQKVEIKIPSRDWDKCQDYRPIRKTHRVDQTDQQLGKVGMTLFLMDEFKGDDQ